MGVLRYRIFKSTSLDSSARLICKWVSAHRPNIDILSVSQVFVGGSVSSTIFWKQSLSAPPQTNVHGYKLRPKTGEKRVTRLPLKIDRLPQATRDAIVRLRQEGKTWLDVEALSAQSFSENWDSDGKGFLDWNALPADVRRLFPGLKLSKSSLHRWHDIRVEQGEYF